MDFNEWEFIPADGFINFEGDEEKIIRYTDWISDSQSVFNMNYLDGPIVPIQLKRAEAKEPQAVKEADQVSQVSFKKVIKEPEFVDIKMESPPRGIVPQIDAASAMESLNSPRMRMEKEISDGHSDDGGDGGINFWKLSLTGIGAICSFATICILFFGSQHRNSHHQGKLSFQIYSDDKKAVKHGTKLNDAISAVRVRGLPLTRGHVTLGGCYEAL